MTVALCKIESTSVVSIPEPLELVEVVELVELVVLVDEVEVEEDEEEELEELLVFSGNLKFGSESSVR